MRQCIQGIALAVLLTTPATAQLPAIGAPRGIVRFGIGGDFANTSNQFFQGAEEPYRAQFATTVLGTAYYPGLAANQAQIATLSGNGGYALSIGGATMQAQASVGTLQLAATVGVTSKLSVFGVVPIVRQQVQVDYHYDSAGANAGFNPADPVFGTAAGRDSVSLFLADYKAALDTLDLRLQTGYYDGNPADSALAVATLATGTAYWAGLTSLFVAPGEAADFVPLAGSAAGQAMAGAVTTTQGNLAALGVPSFTQPLPLPADPLTASGYNNYLSSAGGPILAAPIVTNTSFLLGDVELGASYTIIDRWNRAGHPGGLRLVAQALVRLPTGYQPLPNNFVSLPTGGGQTDLQLSMVADVGGGKVGARFTGTYNDQLSLTSERRVTLPTQPIPWADRLATVTTDPGNELALSALPYFQFAPGLALVGVVRYWSRGADVVDYASSADALPGVSAGELATETQRNAAILGGGLSYAPVQTGAKVPLDAFWLYEGVVSASGGYVPKAGTMRMGLRWPFRVWGGSAE